MLLQIDHGLNNLSNACLVVSAQQGRAISNNQVFADVLQQLREFFGRHDNAFAEKDVAAIVPFDYLGFDVCTTTVRAGIIV